MPVKVLMPALSPTMTEGKLARWLKNEGDTVGAGDVLAEVETDKATMELEAVDEGTLGRILVSGGSEGVPVNTPVALILEEDEDASALDSVDVSAPGAGESTGADQAQGPAGGEKPAGKPVEQPAPQQSAAQPQQQAAPASPEQVTAAPPPPRVQGERVFASPLARRLAKERGIDLSGLQGSGPHGRIVRADVEAAPAQAAQPASAAGEEGLPAYAEVENSTMRKIIAQRLQESKQTIPHFYLTIDCEIDRLLELRKELNARRGDAGKLSVNDFIVRAVALGLRREPGANAMWTENAIRRFETVDVAVAVAVEAGLVTPVVRKADEKSLATLSDEIADLAERARNNKLMPEDYQGGGFTISNLGMYGIKEFSAIINPPQSCILAVGKGEQRPVVKNGEITIATMMTCSLSVDHRSVDGVVGARFLDAFKGYIEDPLAMVL